MTDAVTRLREAVRRHRRATTAEERAREERDSAIADALKADVRPVDVARESGLTSEQVRRIARKHEVPRLREPTVTSRKKADPGAGLSD